MGSGRGCFNFQDKKSNKATRIKVASATPVWMNMDVPDENSAEKHTRAADKKKSNPHTEMTACQLSGDDNVIPEIVEKRQEEKVDDLKQNFRDQMNTVDNDDDGDAPRPIARRASMPRVQTVWIFDDLENPLDSISNFKIQQLHRRASLPMSFGVSLRQSESFAAGVKHRTDEQSNNSSNNDNEVNPITKQTLPLNTPPPGSLDLKIERSGKKEKEDSENSDPDNETGAVRRSAIITKKATDGGVGSGGVSGSTLSRLKQASALMGAAPRSDTKSMERLKSWNSDDIHHNQSSQHRSPPRRRKKASGSRELLIHQRSSSLSSSGDPFVERDQTKPAMVATIPRVESYASWYEEECSETEHDGEMDHVQSRQQQYLGNDGNEDDSVSYLEVSVYSHEDDEEEKPPHYSAVAAAREDDPTTTSRYRDDDDQEEETVDDTHNREGGSDNHHSDEETEIEVVSDSDSDISTHREDDDGSEGSGYTLEANTLACESEVSFSHHGDSFGSDDDDNDSDDDKFLFPDGDDGNVLVEINYHASVLVSPTGSLLIPKATATTGILDVNKSSRAAPPPPKITKVKETPAALLGHDDEDDQEDYYV